MHVYKIKTQSKENCTEQHYEFQSIKSTDSTADCCHCREKRWDHPLLQGFHFCCWDFCAMERGWRGETLKARSFWHVCIVAESAENQPTSTPRPTPPTPPAQPLSVCPQELCIQARLQSLDVLADGYEAEVSVMMERIRKTRKHSGF